ncbi:MAG: bacillithiol biosynthesis BshC [Bacteroidetes bacterium]|nr:bacillithiol biosynthesis BshC [Bacteroidota bacterium]
MAAEDHDFEEINNARIYGKTVTWNRESKGPAGRLNLAGMNEILEEVKTLTADHSDLMAIFNEAYQGTSNLSQATRILFHRLFGAYGLVILDGDQAELKKLFVEEMKTDLLTHDAFKNVNETSLRLGENYKIQVQPREINIFYITDASRNRIVKIEQGYSILNTTKIFSHDEIIEELETHPERFSPNVVLRPLFQEKILPNLAYIGGPGELNYWLQYKQMFEKAAIPFPILLLRNCMMVVDAGNLKKMAKLGLEMKDLFQSSDYLVLKILENSSDIHVGTEEYAALIQKAYSKLSDQFGKLDTSLIATVDAEKQKVLNGLKQLEEKGIRALKRK